MPFMCEYRAGYHDELSCTRQGRYTIMSSYTGSIVRYCRYHLAGGRSWPGVPGMSASAPKYRTPDGRIVTMRQYGAEHRASCPRYVRPYRRPYIVRFGPDAGRTIRATYGDICR
jgi:hypothetical protein